MKVYTHPGTFHSDDVFAVAMLQLAFGENFEIIRTSNLNEVSENDIVVDVGGIYDHDKKRYDHHQIDGPKPRIGKNQVPYASAGLIWEHYGEKILTVFTSDEKIARNVWINFDTEIIQPIDLLDNGYLGSSLKDNLLNKISIPSLINALIPQGIGTFSVDVDSAFLKAVSWIREFCIGAIFQYIQKEKIKGEIIDAVREAKYLGFKWCEVPAGPWQETLLQEDTKQEILYVIYYDRMRNDWKVQCVPKELGSFVCRKALPEYLRGQPNTYINTLYKGVNFVHLNGFIASCASRDDAVNFVEKMCKI